TAHCAIRSLREVSSSVSGLFAEDALSSGSGEVAASSARRPSIREWAVAPSAAAVTAVLATVEAPTPFWFITRSRLAPSSPAPPTRCAPIAARLSGAHLSHPAPEMRIDSLSPLDSWSAALFSPTAPMREPPNHAARPRSCSPRTTVLRWAICIICICIASASKGEKQGRRSCGPLAEKAQSNHCFVYGLPFAVPLSEGSALLGTA